jgi:hypothetical protein
MKEGSTGDAEFVYTLYFFKCIQGYVSADFLKVLVGGQFVTLSYL